MPLIRTLGALTLAAAGVTAAVTLSTPGDQSETVTLTGCVRTGSNPAVHILRGAAAPTTTAPDTATGLEAAEDYLLVSIPAGTDFGALTNHRVAVTGQVSLAKAGPEPPREANAAERALKRLAVQSAKEVAANCSGGE